MHLDKVAPFLAVVAVGSNSAPASDDRKFHGDGRDIILQGFHWHSHAGIRDPNTGQQKRWYRIIHDHVGAIQSAGFTWVWFPPCSDSLAPQGYIPRRWYHFDSAYGSEHELRDVLSALEPVRGLADVVVNHRVGVWTGGADFEDPPFPDNRRAIVRDDESGVGLGNHDTGERHPCGRDLDHTNPDVRESIKEYLRRMKSLGFRGWRYDLVKGFDGKFIGEYNDATKPGFSVGECFDQDRQKVTNWIDAAQGKSTAFDFPTRYLLHDSLRQDDYSRLKSNNYGRMVPGGLIGFWPSRAVTFLDNHDTEYRRESEPEYHNHTTTRHFSGTMVDRGYAYLLTHPGVPCVFWSHFFEWGEQTRRRIEQLMRVRKNMGIHACSHVDIRIAEKGLYAAIIDNRVAIKIGSRDWWPGSGWHHAVDGDRFAVWAR